MVKRISEDELHALLSREVEQFETQLENAIAEEDEDRVETLKTEIASWLNNLAEVFSTPSKQVQSLSRKVAKAGRTAALWLNARPDPQTLSQAETPPPSNVLQSQQTDPTLETATIPSQPISTEAGPADPSSASPIPTMQAADLEAQETPNPPATDDPPQKPEKSEPIPVAKTKKYARL